jgi:hypothetical protein
VSLSYGRINIAVLCAQLVVQTESLVQTGARLGRRETLPCRSGSRSACVEAAADPARGAQLEREVPATSVAGYWAELLDQPDILKARLVTSGRRAALFPAPAPDALP